MILTAVYSFTSHVRSLDLNRNKSVTEISLTYTDPFLLEEIRFNNHFLKSFKAMWIKSRRQVERRCSRMHHTDRLNSHLGAAFGLQSEQQPKKPKGHIEVHWTALNEHQSVGVSERICGCGWPCHLRHLCCNSFEKAEELEKRDVRGEKKECRMNVTGRGQLKARKRVWLHYTGWSIVLQK